MVNPDENKRVDFIALDKLINMIEISFTIIKKNYSPIIRISRIKEKSFYIIFCTSRNCFIYY